MTAMTSDKRGGTPPFHYEKDEELLKRYENWEDILVWLAKERLKRQDETYHRLWEDFYQSYHALKCCGAGLATEEEKQMATEFPSIVQQLMDYQTTYLFRDGFRCFFQLYRELTLDRLMEQCDECTRLRRNWWQRWRGR